MAPGFRQLGERVVYDGMVIAVAVGEFATPDGERFSRDIVRHPGAVAVVPVDGDDVVLVRQFRAAAGRELLEIPAGKRDVDGEAPEETARRELVEEIGRTAGVLTPLAEFYNSIGFSDEYTHVFLATDLGDAVARADGPEEHYMSVERMPLDDVAAAIANGTLSDAKTLVGLSLALRHLGR